ncbi:hypothetical protein H5410_023290 [Solanum commersonii]|uniref:Uncharacterized protein n=1 Tax=Solanum commersonii TaxID=4109 RepID=A0A9J5ZGF0_SOLCO|nr:hypothetical protein H5410_023290 [Solanum commersonii]
MLKIKVKEFVPGMDQLRSILSNPNYAKISGGCSLIGGHLSELLPALARLAASCCCSPVKAAGCHRWRKREKEATGRGGEERTTLGLLVTAAASRRKWMENEREEEAGRR